MDENISHKPTRRLIDTAVKARFLTALRAGRSREEAAAEIGFPLDSLYTARWRDPVFKLGWEWAMELIVIDQRGGELARRLPEGEKVRIVPQNNRPLQRRRMSSIKFTERRQQIYLDHFAGTADSEAAAAAAGISTKVVRAHARKHPEFEAVESEALRCAYVMLEAEAVRQRLEAQRRLSENLEPAGEIAREFERVMKLLDRFDRRDGRIAARERGHGRQRRWTFEEAIHALDKKLNALGIRRGALPPPEEGEEE